MVPVLSLIVPIVVAAVIVFIASSIIHMVLPIHKGDLRKLPNEGEVMDALRKCNLPPGDYALPCAGSMHDMKSPEFLEKMNKGPVALLTVSRPGPPSMGPALAMWFVYCLIVGVFAAYITGRALAPGAHYLAVFRFAGTTAFIGYSLAIMQHSIWYRRSWVTTIKVMIDGLVYGLLTAGVFGWLWPS